MATKGTKPKKPLRAGKRKERPRQLEELKRAKRLRELASDNPPPHEIPASNALLAMINGDEDPPNYQRELRKIAKQSVDQSFQLTGQQAPEESEDGIPLLVLRAYSLEGKSHTKGYSSKTIYQPALDKHQHRDCHGNLHDISDEEIIVMLRNHIL